AAPPDHLEVTGLSSGPSAIAFADGPLSSQDRGPSARPADVGMARLIPGVAAGDHVLGARPDRGRPLPGVGKNPETALGAPGTSTTTASSPGITASAPVTAPRRSASGTPAEEVPPEPTMPKNSRVIALSRTKHI